MQDINDDMDDLFRKAAEQYPLKTDGADWQKVFAGLQETSMPAAEEKEKRKRRALWLFWLVPLGLLLSAIYYKSDNQPAQQIAATKEAANNSLHNDVVKNETNNNSQKSDVKINKEMPSAAMNMNDSTTASSSVKAKNNLEAFDKSGDQISFNTKDSKKAHTESGLYNYSGNSSFFKKEKENLNNNQEQTSHNKNEFITNKNTLPVLQPNTASNRIDKKDAGDNNGDAMSKLTQGKSAEASGALPAKTDSLALNTAKADSALHITKTDSAVNNNNSNENKSKMVKAKPRKQTGFYAGILASLDVSTIKLQRINKAGHGFELLIGYRLSKRLSVESGVNWTDKKYYSTGKYFDKTNTGIPEASKIIYTNGSCAMFEIPASVKYDFAQKKSSNWFTTAGLSSYIMKDEQYSYYANHSGNYYNATKKYSNSGSNLFSVASLSFGYQLQINKHLSLRAEPYIKMPLSGIGIAKLPIASTGIAVGFTRSF